MLPILEKPSPPILFPFSRNFHFADSLRFNIALLPALAILLASIPTARIRGGSPFRLSDLTGSGRIVASQHRKRLAHDSQGWRGAGASRFRFGGKKEAAGVCRGCGESMEFQSQTAD